MTVFKTWAFPATGGSASRTLPDRLAEIHSVKDFGATGLGFPNDDLGAIMDAIDWQTSNTFRGVIYFPPGEYYVSAPIDFDATFSPVQTTGLFVSFLGEMGRSVIIGDFADYVLRRGVEGPTRSTGPWSIDKLTIINSHAGGGGIRFGSTQIAAIRDCDITADIAINDDNTDSFIDGGNINGAFELIIENCNLRPYNTLATGSIGIYKCSDGPVTNCTFVGFDTGMCTASGQGGAAIQGCYFEGNNYGFRPGHGVEAHATSAGGNFVVEGCHFKNNGVAITGSGSGIYRGIYIEAATGSISGNPQYGIRCPAGRSAASFSGISIDGDFQQYGVSLVGGEGLRHFGTFAAIGSTNSVSSQNWELPPTAMTSRFTAINKADVFTVGALPAATATISTISWSSGTVSVFFTPGVDSDPTGRTAYLTVSGVTPSAYNGAFTGTFVDNFHLTYPLVSNPGSSGSGASMSIFFVASSDGITNAYEGETYNVRDANTATWGDPVTAGGGSNHVKVRFTPAAWTVVGK